MINFSTKDDISEQLSKSIGEQLQICLDVSREAFVYDTSCTLYRLVIAKNLQRSTGYRRMLVGQKGVGKTMLLKAIIDTSGEFLCSKGLICIYASLDDIENRDLLITSLITRELKNRYHFDIDSNCTINQLEQYLEKRDKALFLAIDEVQLAYTNHSQIHGKDIIHEIMSIGSSRGGRIHCIISGNNAVLDKLCFAKMSMDEALSEGYIHYNQIDINCSKFHQLSN